MPKWIHEFVKVLSTFYLIIHPKEIAVAFICPYKSNSKGWCINIDCLRTDNTKYTEICREKGGGLRHRYPTNR